MAIGGSLLLTIAIGFGVKLWPQSPAAHSHSGDQPRLAEASGLLVSDATVQSPTQFPTVRPEPSPIVITSIPDGRYSLFSAAVQVHLESVAQATQGMGVAMSVSNFYLNDNHLFISVCFAAPGPESRMIGPTTLTYSNGDSSAFGVNTTLDEMTPGSDPTFKHCDTLEFQHIELGAQLSHLGLVVQSVSFSATAPDGQTCQLTDGRIANSKVLRQLGISARCSERPGWSGLQIVAKPDSMTDSEALNIAGRESIGMILGPWIFENIPLTVD